MSNDVQPHEEVAERVAGEERRVNARHAARSLGSVTARIIGGSQVDLVNFSNRGVLFECDSRLLIGARASVRITTTDANLVVTGRVVRSRVKGLVNGALRYDAALVLDAELGLSPTFVDVPAIAGDSADVDELFTDDAGVDTNSDPSPVEAYLAESEASLLEVAQESDLLLQPPVSIDPVVDAEFDAAPEPPPIPELASPAIEAAGLEAPSEPEPIAFEADADIAFEPAVEFAFDEAGEEPASASMFDATYMPPVAEDVAAAASQFDVTPPSVAVDAMPPAFFDARPSVSYGDASADATLAFESEDGVMFEEAGGDVPAIEAPAVLEGADAGTDDAFSTSDAFTSGLPEAAPGDPVDSCAAVSDTEDRVLLQFAATVPHDLAELRRIAADNQW